MASADAYQRDIARGLSRAYADPATEQRDLELSTARLIVFSDHHKGSRDGADDFRRCERAYNAALAYYFESGHTLVVLGDVEELWECDAREVLPKYERTLGLEAQFHAQGRYERFWGNHDDRWSHADEVAEHLDRPGRFPGLRVREALKLRVVDQGSPLGTLFLVHGHQGTLESDRFSGISRLIVRYLWRPLQRRLNFASTTPSRDWKLRERHDSAMFAWARAERHAPVLIAGHTHRPVFWESTPDTRPRREPSAIEAELDTEQARPDPDRDRDRIRTLRAELEYTIAEARRADHAAQPVAPPCYFNTGCCSFGDGDITGLEIADGEIRLVRWPDSDDQPRPKVLARAQLTDVLDAVAGRRSSRAPAGMETA